MRIRRHQPGNQGGYILLAIMLLMTLMLIALSVEAPRVAQQIKREKEEELIHRGNEYRNAIKKYFRKFGRYPVSIDQLENTNNMRFLRKRYKDPITGKDDWKLIHVGEVQLNLATGSTNVVGQGPGQPLNGPTAQPGAGASTTAQPQPGTTTDQNSSGTGGTTSNGPGGAMSPNSSLSPIGSSSQQFGGGPIIGVQSVSKLTSIKEPDGKNHYNEWPPFFYDPRMEQQAMIPAGGVPGANSIGPGGIGQNPGQNPGMSPNGPVFAPGGGSPVNSPSKPPGTTQ